MAKFTDIQSRKREAKEALKGIDQAEARYRVAGQEKSFDVAVVAGEIAPLEITTPLGEMITSDQGTEEFLKKVTVDVELGKEEVPTLYGSIYRTISDRNLPEYIDAPFSQSAGVFFAQWQEGEEIKFGTLNTEEGQPIKLLTYAAGFEYTEDVVEYNKIHDIQMLNQAFGEAYNARLNEVHFSPILTYTYPAQNKTAADTDANKAIALKNTLRNAVQASIVAKRPGSVLLASSQDRFKIESAMQNEVIDGNSHFGVTGIDEVVFYDGWSVTVGKKTYTFNGVTPGKCYLIQPKKGFIEYEKHGLIIDAATADLSRLIESQVVARTRRGVYADVQGNVQEITLP